MVKKKRGLRDPTQTSLAGAKLRDPLAGSGASSVKIDDPVESRLSPPEIVLRSRGFAQASAEFFRAQGAPDSREAWGQLRALLARPGGEELASVVELLERWPGVEERRRVVVPYVAAVLRRAPRLVLEEALEGIARRYQGG